jgi:hypothetical protein
VLSAPVVVAAEPAECATRDEELTRTQAEQILDAIGVPWVFEVRRGDPACWRQPSHHAARPQQVAAGRRRLETPVERT